LAARKVSGEMRVPGASAPAVEGFFAYSICAQGSAGCQRGLCNHRRLLRARRACARSGCGKRGGAPPAR